MSNYADQLREEQSAIDHAYGRLDDLRSQTKERLDKVRAAGSHGSPTQRTERDSFATMYEDRLTQLRAVEDRLVFGRLDDEHNNRRYIGRIGLSDNTHNPILTDWRAEAARPFYEATPSHHGDIVMRRHITLHFREVIGIEDEVLDINAQQVSEAHDQGTLTGEGALLASLSSRRTGKMTDIVATIQAEQDRIIRADLSGAVVVQGGPGTGKTAVALHRAAYLLYTHRRMLNRSGVLIVGPSTTFLHYIDQVLPSLGETGVVSRTIADLIPGIIATTQDDPYVAQIKGDARMAKVIANAIARRERVPSHLPTITINGNRLEVRAHDIQTAIADARRTHQPHNKARETFVTSMLSMMQNQYAQQLDYVPDQQELHEVLALLRMNDKLRICLNKAWLPMSGTWLVDQLLCKPEQLRACAPWLSDEQVMLLMRPKHAPFTQSDVPLLDEAMEHLGPDPREAQLANARNRERREQEEFAKETLAQAGIGSGIVSSSVLADYMSGNDDELVSQRAAADREWTYGHIVVDEAQELTAMDWRMLIRRCPSRSFTIVGDVAQTTALGGTRDWAKTMDKLFLKNNWKIHELTIDYRNPREVSDLASDFAKREGLYISTVNAVRSIPNAVERITVDSYEELCDAAGKTSATLAQEFINADGTGRIAIITPHQLHDTIRQSLWTACEQVFDHKVIDQLKSQSAWDEQISVIDAHEVKGLEYDAVVVVEPGLIEEEAPSRLSAASDLYVALTRPTQRLSIVRTQKDTQRIFL